MGEEMEEVEGRWGVLFCFPVAVMKYSDKRNLREEGFYSGS